MIGDTTYSAPEPDWSYVDGMCQSATMHIHAAYMCNDAMMTQHHIDKLRYLIDELENELEAA